MLKGAVFLHFDPIRDDLTPQQFLAAVGMHSLVKEFGVQIAGKRVGPQQWAYFQKRFFKPTSEGQLPDIRSLMRKTVVEWLEDRVRFPRLAPLRSEA